jgi:hypothetical protein
MSPVQNGLLASIPLSTLYVPNAQTPVSRAARFESAGYYFGYDRQSRTWDMEKRLYDSIGFKSLMLCVLAALFACLTVVAFYF